MIKQIDNNNALAEDAIFLPFVRGRPAPPPFHRPIEVPIDITYDHAPSTVPVNESAQATDRTVDPDITADNDPAQSNRAASQSHDDKMPINKSLKDFDLLFHVDRVTGH